MTSPPSPYKHGQSDQARTAAELAPLTAPNEAPQLDLAAILAHEGRHADAAQAARKAMT